jgi:hypothetical protein
MHALCVARLHNLVKIAEKDYLFRRIGANNEVLPQPKVLGQIAPTQATD